MARILGTFPAALIAARGGMSANAFYQELRSLGVAARRSEVLAVFRLAKEITAVSGNEPFADPNRAPSDQALKPWPSKKATGVLQTVTLAYRDRTTGQLQRTFWSIRTEQGIERAQAVEMAVNAYTLQAERYNQDLIGAIHTSSYQLLPESG